MSDRDREENGRKPVSLDDVLVEVGRALAQEVRRPDESTIIAYLGGIANELQIREVRKAVVHSPEFRGDLVELKRTMDELAAPGTAERFDQLEAGAAPRFESVLGPGRSPAASPPTRPATPRRRLQPWLEGFRGLLRKPAYACALVLVLIAYPVYRVFFADGPSPHESPAPVIPAVDFFLREDPRGVVRGETDRPRLPQLTIEAAVSFVRLTLEVPRPSAAESWHATLSDPSGEIWRSEAPLRVHTVDEDRVVVLELDPRTIAPGIVTIVLEEVDDRALARPAVYRFILDKRE